MGRLRFKAFRLFELGSASTVKVVFNLLASFWVGSVKYVGLPTEKAAKAEQN